MDRQGGKSAAFPPIIVVDTPLLSAVPNMAQAGTQLYPPYIFYVNKFTV
jgi:hypothetical protein